MVNYSINTVLVICSGEGKTSLIDSHEQSMLMLTNNLKFCRTQDRLFD